MKSHKLLYQLKNKLTWLPILILAACQNNIIYHSYAPVPLDGWDKSDTLVYTLPNSIPAGNYEAEIGIRYQGDMAGKSDGCLCFNGWSDFYSGGH